MRGATLRARARRAAARPAFAPARPRSLVWQGGARAPRRLLGEGVRFETRGFQSGHPKMDRATGKALEFLATGPARGLQKVPPAAPCRTAVEDFCAERSHSA